MILGWWPGEQFFINYYNFNPFWGTPCINPGRKVLVLKSKEVTVKVSYKIYSEPGMEPEPESKEIFAAPRSRSQNKFFRLRNNAT